MMSLMSHNLKLIQATPQPFEGQSTEGTDHVLDFNKQIKGSLLGAGALQAGRN